MLFFLAVNAPAIADPPSTAYIFPAGGQRGKTVQVRVGGYNLHEAAQLFMQGTGLNVPKTIQPTNTIFFEGPVIPQPASQKGENYPKDYAASFKISAQAKLGPRIWRVGTSQGVSAGRVFVVGDLPEITEREIDGRPVPSKVNLPVTINGRIFPREDIDIWTFSAKKNQTITCEVNAARIGSPLDSRLEVRDNNGRPIAENVDALGVDSRLTFTAPKTGQYSVRIHDVTFQGLQSYVYRLTLTTGPLVKSVYPLGGRRGSSVSLELTGDNLPVNKASVEFPKSTASFFSHRLKTTQGLSNEIRLEQNNLPEILESKSNFQIIAPAILNGRILKAGEIDSWKLAAKKGDSFLLDLKAARLGSRLDSVLTAQNSAGKIIGTADDLGKGKTDSKLRLKIPTDGIYTIQIRDQLSTRGGPQYGYRLHVTKSESSTAGFRLQFPTDALTVNRGGAAKLKLTVERLGGFKGEIDLNFPGLLSDVSVTGTKIGKNKRTAQLTLTAKELAKIGISKIRISGTAKIDEKNVTVLATSPSKQGLPESNEIWLAVAVPTPFKFTGVFETKYASRGSTYSRHYSLDLGDYKGPITVKLADLQARHLQGVAGRTIVLPPGTTEFDYPVALPPWMEIGRTSRTCIMVIGTLIDEAGKKHRVSYSSKGQNDQVILLIDPARLSVRCQQKTIRKEPGKTVFVNMTIARGNGLTGPVALELVIPSHITGVTASRVTIPAGQTNGSLRLQFASGKSSPINMPLTVRATLLGSSSKRPYVAETPISVIAVP